MKNAKLIIISCVLMVAAAACTVQGHVVAVEPGITYVRPAPPGPGYVWVGDTWVWSGGRYIYRHGYWVHPRPGRVWVEGRWTHTRGGVVWMHGHWDRR